MLRSILHGHRTLRGMLLLAAITAVVLPSLAHSEPAPAADKWSFAVTPYVYLPNINGTLKYSIPPGTDSSPEVETGPNDYLQNLQAIVMLSGEARKSRWSLFGDIVYIAFGDEDSKVKAVDFGTSIVSSSLNLATQTSLRGVCWTLGAGYQALGGKGTTLDVFGGLRYFDLTASSDWQLSAVVTGPSGSRTFPMAGGISQSLTLLDGIVGVRGRYQIGGSSWSVPYYVDIGTGAADLTYQAMIGIAWAFNEWGTVTLAYRDLYFDQTADKFIQDLRFTGPALGVTFRF